MVWLPESGPAMSAAHSLAARLKAGTVWINCYNIFDAALPFGGYKQSAGARDGAVLDNYLATGRCDQVSMSCAISRRPAEAGSPLVVRQPGGISRAMPLALNRAEP
jgi:hypothetical protein